MKVPIRKLLVAAVGAALAPLAADAGSISVNFSENPGNQGFVGGENIGPLSTNSSNWNSTNGEASLVAGSLSNLIDDANSNTGASMDWNSSSVWWNDDGTGSDETRLSVGYLDDGDSGSGNGVEITFNDIPYAEYFVHILLASDNGEQADDEGFTLDTYTTLDFSVNGNSALGTGTATAYNNIASAFADAGSNWVQIDPGVTTGNYITTTATGSTLTIVGQVRNGGERGSVTGVIIEEVPEPGSLALLSIGGLLIARRRRE